MLLQTQVGPTVSRDWDLPVLRSGKQGDLIISGLHGRYYETAYRKNMFFAATQTGQNTTVSMSSVYTGLVVSNPVGNIYNFAINKVSAGWSVIPATLTVLALGVGFDPKNNVTHTTPTTPFSTYFGSGALSTAKVDTSATLTGIILNYIALTNARVANNTPNGAISDVEGGLIIPPGTYVFIATQNATSLGAFWGSIQWEEIPI